MRWIAFSEREPTQAEQYDGCWLGTHEKRRDQMWVRGSGQPPLARLHHDHGYTHFYLVTPPTDLPSKPLPELSTGSEWHTTAPSLTIVRPSCRFWFANTSRTLLHVQVDEGREALIPLADIEALKEAGK